MLLVTGWPGFFFTTATILGAMHCIGWSDNVSFSSFLIQGLWRFSSAVITASPMLWACNYVLYHATDNYRYEKGSMNVCTFTVFAFEHIAACSLFFYFFCRITIAVIAIKELGYAPQGALASIKWASLFPHIH